MNLNNLTKDERSLLLFFESACVEKGGLLHSQHMNAEDMELAKKWAKRKKPFVHFRRLKFEIIEHLMNRNTHEVWLSPLAWRLAQEERRARANRIRDRHSASAWVPVISAEQFAEMAT